MFLALASMVASVGTPAALRISMADRGEALVRVAHDMRDGYWLHIDCVEGCTRPLHFKTQVEVPLGLVSLDTGGLLYSVWGTGCCFMVRVFRLRSNRVDQLLETGSRSLPSLITRRGIVIETYMRPTDSKGRDTSFSLQPIRWVYAKGVFKRSRR